MGFACTLLLSSHVRLRGYLDSKSWTRKLSRGQGLQRIRHTLVWEDSRTLTLAEFPPVALDLLALSLNCWHRRVSASCATMNASRLALRLSCSKMSFSRIMLESMAMLVMVGWLKVIEYETPGITGCPGQWVWSCDAVACIASAPPTSRV